MRYWLKKFGADEETFWEEFRRRHFGSQEGDWIYPREKNCRFLDFFEECPAAHDRNMSMSFLVALFIIKCAIVRTYNETRTSIDSFFETTDGQRIQQVQSVVTEMIIDQTIVNIESQWQQVQQLTEVILRKNPSVRRTDLIPADFIPPRPLSASNDRPEEISSENRPEERIQGQPRVVAFFILCLIYCIRCLARVPGAKAMLKYCFGKHPSFDQ